MNKNQLKSLLQYKSTEMIPSTQLIRKSRQVFDSLQEKEIEKAVILRDGKPSFILMDFKKYEQIINYFIDNNISIDNELELLEEITTIKNETNKIDKNKVINKDTSEVKKETKSSLLEKLDSIEGIINNDNTEVQNNLKEFWE